MDDDSLYASWVGSDFVREGQDAGYWLEDYMKKQGREDDGINIVVLKGTKGASATIGRARGFNEVAKGAAQLEHFAAGRRRIYHSKRKKKRWQGFWISMRT